MYIYIYIFTLHWQLNAASEGLFSPCTDTHSKWRQKTPLLP